MEALRRPGRRSLNPFVKTSPIFLNMATTGKEASQSQQTVSQRALRALDDAIAKLEAAKQAKNEPVAIVGMACRFPGGADDPRAFWELLRAGVDAIRQVPSGRWDMETWHGNGSGEQGKICTREGGYLDEVDRFDASYFGISPREASSLDPQHRLLLEVAVEALESAGCMPDRLGENKTGVFIGITNNDYLFLLKQSAGPEAFDGYLVTGNSLNSAAGRLSYCLGLSGPSLAVDTACSSSLVALHLACQSLRAGECDSALAGGVNLILAPEGSAALSRAGMLSPDGRCKTFDAGADGYGRGEGCGVVILKLLSAALKDRDHILAVIRASAVNQDGPSGGFTVPSGPAQEALIRKALKNARLAPADISYLEAHGTGTSLGDPIEVGALANVLGEGRPPDQPLLAGSVKTNLGHLESAAGIASLIKVILALQHSELPPLANFKQRSPRIAWDEMPVRLVTERMAWRRSGGPRRAGISSFGVSGTNAHLIVEEAPAPEPSADERPGACHVLALSAKSPQALRELTARFESFLLEHPEVRFGDVCFTTNAGRAHHRYRLSATACAGAETAGMLRAFQEGTSCAGLSVAESTVEPEVAWFFPGGNFLRPKTARKLHDTQAVFRSAFDHCAQVAREQLGLRLTGFLHGESAPEGALAQVAELAFEYALAQLWKSWNVHPVAVFGAGVGNCAAACIAEVFEVEDALKLAATRLGLGQRFGEFELAAKQISFREPSIRCLCGRSGRLISDEVATPDYWIQELKAPAEARSVPAGLRKIDIAMVLGGTPAEFADAESHASDAVVVLQVSPEDSPAARTVFEALGALYGHGAAVHWKAVVSGAPRRCPALPTYPWQRQRYWITSNGAAARTIPPPSSGPLLARLLAQDGEQLVAELEKVDRLTDVERALVPKLLQTLIAVDRANLSTSAIPDWLYTVQWKSSPPEHRRAASDLASPKSIAARLARVVVEEPRPAYLETIGRLEELSVAFIVRALTTMGWSLTKGRRFHLDEAAHALHIHVKNRQLFRRLFGILAETGALAATDDGGDSWEVLRTLEFDEKIFDTRTLLAKCPEAFAEITLCTSCAANLPTVLRGELDPLELLFAADQPVSAASLYCDSPGARRMNALIRESVAAALDRLPSDSVLRVLEIGAGTGATTLELLTLFPKERTEYWFTDISPGFTSLAKQKFHDYPFLRCQVLDIEKDPARQGFKSESYDLVIAANVLHATADVRQALEHTRALLAPGGLLILRESTSPLRYVDLIFGLTEGWWRFTDRALRPTHPLLSVAQWHDLLEAERFTEVAAGTQPLSREGKPISTETILLARGDRQALAKTPRQWLIFADRDGTAIRLAAILRSRGDSCSLVSKGPNFEAVGEHAFTINPEKAGDFHRLFAETGSGMSHHILYLWSLDCQVNSDPATEAEMACHACLNLVQALLSAGFAAMPSLTLITRAAMPTTGSAPNCGFSQAGIWGIGRILALEHPECDCALIDLDVQASPTEADAILAECIQPKRIEPQIAFRARCRWVPRLARYTPQSASKPALEPDACYLITGGLGGLGLSVADWMVARGAKHLVLAGRSAPDSLALEKLNQLQQSGASPLAVRADVSQRDDVARLLADIDASGHPLRGVIHAAGLLDDGVLRQLSWERFRRVLQPKIMGAWHLHQLTLDRPLDFFVLFSSATALLGSPGQANHVAANTFLDAFAHYRRAQGLPALSIDWGPWAEVGAAARSQIGGRVRAKGIGMIPPAQALEALGELIRQSTQVGVVPIDWEKFTEEIARQPFFQDFAVSPAHAQEPDNFLEGFQAAAPAKRRELVLHHTQLQIAKVLGLDPAAPLDLDQSFLSLGLDSLTSVELRNNLQKSLSIPLPATMAYDHPDTAKLAAFLLAELSQSRIVAEPSPAEQNVQERPPTC